MTTKSDFSSEEWTLLVQAPMSVSALITLSSPALGDALKESMAVAKQIAATAQADDNGELLAALVGEYQNKDEIKQAQPEMKSKDPNESMDQLLASLSAAADVLNAKTLPEEADEVKQWLNSLAVTAAEAAKEGDFMGIGGVRVNDKEKAMLRQIAQSLGA